MAAKKRGPLWVWILESDSIFRSTLASITEFEGLAPIELKNIDEADRLYRNFVRFERTPFLILSAFQFSEGTSEDFLVRCRDRFPMTPICCVSSSLNGLLRSRLRKKGIHTFSKPITLKDLLDCFSKISER